MGELRLFWHPFLTLLRYYIHYKIGAKTVSIHPFIYSWSWYTTTNSTSLGCFMIARRSSAGEILIAVRFAVVGVAICWDYANRITLFCKWRTCEWRTTSISGHTQVSKSVNMWAGSGVDSLPASNLMHVEYVRNVMNKNIIKWRKSGKNLFPSPLHGMIGLWQTLLQELVQRIEHPWCFS